MICLFRRKMFFIVNYFQRNQFLEKIISLKIFSDVWLIRKNHQRRKTIDYEILSVAGKILATFTGFQLLLPDSGDGGRNPVAMARFRPI
jgi:hypothetical protein